MELFALEHKRLWRTPRVWICVLLCFAYSVIWGTLFQYQWLGFGTQHDTTDPYDFSFDGYSNIRGFQEQFSQFGDNWTDETLQKMVAAYQSYDIYEKPGLGSMGDWVVASDIKNQCSTFGISKALIISLAALLSQHIEWIDAAFKPN